MQSKYTIRRANAGAAAGTPRRRGPKLQARMGRFFIQRWRCRSSRSATTRRDLNEFGVSTRRAWALIWRSELSRGRCHYWLGLRIATRRRCGDHLGVSSAWRFRARRNHMHSRRGMPCHKRRPGRTAGIDGRSKKGSLPPEQGLAFGHSGSETSDGRRWNSEFQRA